MRTQMDNPAAPVEKNADWCLLRIGLVYYENTQRPHSKSGMTARSVLAGATCCPDNE